MTIQIRIERILIFLTCDSKLENRCKDNNLIVNADLVFSVTVVAAFVVADNHMYILLSVSSLCIMRKVSSILGNCLSSC